MSGLKSFWMRRPFLSMGQTRSPKSYLCTPIGGQPEPGAEPEDENFEIAALRWFDLRDEKSWSVDLKNDPFTYPQLVKIRHLLGYTTQIQK